MKTGRPPIFKDSKELDKKIEEYKKQCDEKQSPFTIIGLACFIGIAKDTIIEYGKKDGFSDSYKKALAFAERSLVDNGLNGSYNPTLTIFLLKNNHNYKDKHEVDSTSSDGSMTPKETSITFTPVGKDD